MNADFINKQQIYPFKKACFCLICCFLNLYFLCTPTYAHAQESASKTVRVGYYQSKGFQEGGENGTRRSGYSYEYLQKIASYTGWKYEYVPGTWSDLYQKLKTGEIDLMAGVSDEEQREADVLFPDYEMLKETFYIYKDSEDLSMQNGVYASYAGKKIGVTKDTKMMQSLQNWNEQNHVGVDIILFDNLESCAAAFNHNEIDGFVSADNVVSGFGGITPVEMIGKVPYYLCVANSCPELLSELNQSLVLLNGQDTTYLVTLRNKYTADTAISIFLSKQEQTWMAAHPKIRVGYLDSYMPYCSAAADGSANGLLKEALTDIFDILPGNYEPEIVYTIYKNQADMLQALQQDEIDLIFPVTGDFSYAEQHSYQQSSAVTQATVDLVCAKGYDGSIPRRISVNKNNQMQYAFSQMQYPDAEFILYDSAEDCIRAVKENQVDCTLIEALRAVQYVGNDKKINFFPLKETCDFCFGVQYGNGDFLRVLNHGISMLGDEYGISHAYQYISDVVSLGIRDKVRIGGSVFVLLIILSVSSICLSRYRAKKKYQEQQLRTEQEYSRALEQKNQELKDLLEKEQTYNTKLYHDALTSAYNRRYYEEVAVESFGPAGVAIMDLDNFKGCNDTYGHHVGDLALETVADTIFSCIRKNDKLIRYGGDEFLLILPDIPAELLKPKLELICAKVRETEVPGYTQLHLSLSIGGAMQHAGDAFKEVMRCADQLLYQAKKRKNTVVVENTSKTF